MTLQQAKDQVAQKYRFKDWEDVVLQFQAKNHVDEVAELYARSKWDEACESQRTECSRCLEVDVPKSPTHNLVLYAPKPEFKP